MKKNNMQKMTSFYKNLKLFALCILMTMATFGCISSTQNQGDEQAKQAQDLENALKNSDNGKMVDNPDISEGLVPPVNQNIMLVYYVQAGDSLAGIAKKIYGDKRDWKKLAELNNLIDPHKIYAGDVIYYTVTEKSKIFSETYEGAPKAKIIVKKGDTLTHISKAVFGKAKDWRVLWKENPQITNPDKLKVGDVIYFRPKALTAEASSFSSSIVETKKDNEKIMPVSPNEEENDGTKESKAEM